MSLTPEMPPAAGGETDESPPPTGRGRRAAGVIGQVAIALAVLGGAGLLAYYLIATPPEARQKPTNARAVLVDVEPVVFGVQPVVIRPMGTVRPARSVVLQPRVGGEIVEVSDEFVPGGYFDAGKTLLQIDRQDYELALAHSELELAQARLAIQQCGLTIEQRRSNVARTEGELTIEQGQQAIARDEFEMLGADIADADKELVLRQPQFRTAQAATQAAKAALKEAEVAQQVAEATASQAENSLRKAQLDLQRTTIQAPFNAVVQARDVDLGATVSPTTRLTTLVGTDEYWVEVSVPVDRLRWIRIPRANGEEGSRARVYNEAAWGPGGFRTGRVCRLASDLEDQGRMARLLVTVKDPLALAEANRGQPVLLIDSYVSVEIEGREVPSAAAVKRSLLHDGDNLWVMNQEDRLEIRPVTVTFRNRETVLVADGLKPGERLVTTDLPAPVEGMPLRLRIAEPASSDTSGGGSPPAPAGEATP